MLGHGRPLSMSCEQLDHNLLFRWFFDLNSDDPDSEMGRGPLGIVALENYPLRASAITSHRADRRRTSAWRLVRLRRRHRSRRSQTMRFFHLLLEAFSASHC